MQGWVKQQPLRFVDGFFEPPLNFNEAVTVVYRIPSHGRVIGFYFMSLMTIVTIASIVWIYRMRHTAVMKAGPVSNLVQAILGLLIMEISWYFFAMDSSMGLTKQQLHMTCNCHYYSLFFGFLVTYIAFVSKQIKVTEANRQNGLIVPSKRVLQCVAFSLPVGATFVFIYMALFDNIVWTERIIERDFYGVPTVVSEFCWSESYHGFNIFFVSKNTKRFLASPCFSVRLYSYYQHNHALLKCTSSLVQIAIGR